MNIGPKTKDVLDVFDRAGFPAIAFAVMVWLYVQQGRQIDALKGVIERNTAAIVELTGRIK